MSHLDPNRDFRDSGELPPRRYDADHAARASNAAWGWILGGVAAVVVVLIALTFAGTDTKTASNVPSAPPASTRPAVPPAPPAATTGQGSGTSEITPPAEPAPPSQQ